MLILFQKSLSIVGSVQIFILRVGINYITTNAFKRTWVLRFFFVMNLRWTLFSVKMKIQFHVSVGGVVATSLLTILEKLCSNPRLECPRYFDCKILPPHRFYYTTTVKSVCILLCDVNDFSIKKVDTTKKLGVFHE